MTTEHLRFLKKFRRRRRMVVFLRILILFLFLLQWEICADTGVVDSFIFSSPSRIITCFLKMTEDGSVFHHIGITLYETLVSFLLVTLTSILIAILLWCRGSGYFRKLQRTFRQQQWLWYWHPARQ